MNRFDDMRLPAADAALSYSLPQAAGELGRNDPSALQKNGGSLREAYVRIRAKELAISGRYANWRRIEARLVVDGYPDARSIFESPLMRDAIDALCFRNGEAV